MQFITNNILQFGNYGRFIRKATREMYSNNKLDREFLQSYDINLTPAECETMKVQDCQEKDSGYVISITFNKEIKDFQIQRARAI